MKLKNALRTAQHFNLPHASYCATGACACTPTVLQVRETLSDGRSGFREVPRLLSTSITLLALEVLEVDDRARSAPEVKAALDRGDLREVKS